MYRCYLQSKYINTKRPSRNFALPFSEDELEEANGNNPIDLELDQNKESKKEVFLPSGRWAFARHQHRPLPSRPLLSGNGGPARAS